LFSNSTWKSQQGAYSHRTMEKPHRELIPRQKTGLPTGQRMTQLQGKTQVKLSVEQETETHRKRGFIN